MTLFEKLSLFVTTIGFWNCLVFCLLYHIRTKGSWRRTEHGQWMMISSAVIGSLFMLIVSTRMFGDWPGRQWIILGLYITYVAGTAWPLRLLYLSFARKDQEPEHTSGSSLPGPTVGVVDRSST